MVSRRLVDRGRRDIAKRGGIGAGMRELGSFRKMPWPVALIAVTVELSRFWGVSKLPP